MKMFFNKVTAGEIRDYIESRYSGKELEINDTLLNEIIEHFNIDKIEAFNPHPLRKGKNNIYHIIYSDCFYRYFISADKPNTFKIERFNGKTSSFEFEFGDTVSAVNFLQAMTDAKNSLKRIKITVEQ